MNFVLMAGLKAMLVIIYRFMTVRLRLLGASWDPTWY
jgi:hypothetical protein